MAKNHINIITVLSKVRKGLTRNDILKKTKLKSGDAMTKAINELIASGFVDKYTVYEGKKYALFRLTDEYSLFYLKFIKNKPINTTNYWQTMYSQNSYKIWSGFSFESICIKHINQIRIGLKISGILTISASWVEKNETQGAQIDLLIDRADNTINICEMKFHNDFFSVDKAYANSLRNKINVFKNKTKTKKNVLITNSAYK